MLLSIVAVLAWKTCAYTSQNYILGAPSDPKIDGGLNIPDNFTYIQPIVDRHVLTLVEETSDLGEIRIKIELTDISQGLTADEFLIEANGSPFVTIDEAISFLKTDAATLLIATPITSCLRVGEQCESSYGVNISKLLVLIRTT